MSDMNIPAAKQRTVNSQILFGDILGGVLILYIVFLCLSSFRPDYDALWYHLPFAALRTDIIPANQLSLIPRLVHRYAGFPQFISIIQGVLWKVSGTPLASSLINPIAILTLSLYVRLTFKVSLIWMVLIFFAIPILQTALYSSYTDLWTNTFFSLHLLSGYKGLLRRDGRLKHSLISIVALGIAVNSKEQYYVIGAVSFILFLIAHACLSLRSHQTFKTLMSNRNTLIFIVLAPIAFYAPLKNLVKYHNPVYPEVVHIGAVSLPGTENNHWLISPDVRALPQPVRFILSELDFDGTHHLNTYTIDQRQTPDGKLGLGTAMGGSLGFLFIISVSYLFIILSRTRLGRAEIAALAGGLTLVVVTACFPGSNELRYFSYIEICLIATCLIVFHSLPAQQLANVSAWKTSLQIILISSAVYVCMATRFIYVLPTDVPSARTLSQWQGVPQKLQKLGFPPVICYQGPKNNALLYTYYFNKNAAPHPYKIIEIVPPNACPAGLPIIKN